MVTITNKHTATLVSTSANIVNLIMKDNQKNSNTKVNSRLYGYHLVSRSRNSLSQQDPLSLDF